jgi:hypothetical protein
MLNVMRKAKAEGCDLIVYRELALTTFFPRWYYEDHSEGDIWFERDMPGPATRPLFEPALEFGVAMSFGYAELMPDGRHFNTCKLRNRDTGLRRQTAPGVDHAQARQI